MDKLFGFVPTPLTRPDPSVTTFVFTTSSSDNTSPSQEDHAVAEPSSQSLDQSQDHSRPPSPHETSTSTEEESASAPSTSDRVSSATTLSSQESSTTLEKLEEWAWDLLNSIVTHVERIGNLSRTERGPSCSITSKYLDESQRKLILPRKGGSGDDIHFGAQDLRSLLRAAEIVAQNLRLDKRITKRDLYYLDPVVFRDQRNADTLVDSLKDMLSISRHELNIVASPKGMVAGGALVFHFSDQTTLPIDSVALIPDLTTCEWIEYRTKPSWLVVVEKEAVFQTLTSTDSLSYLEKRLGPGIIITGKGYPDYATRQLLIRIAADQPSLPMLTLTDGDPHGFEIAQVYKHGARNAKTASENLACDRLEWIGLFPSKVYHDGELRDKMVPLTKEDRKKGLQMLQRPDCSSLVRCELSLMLFGQYKAEIECLSQATDEARDEHATFHESRLHAYFIEAVQQALGAR